MHKRINMHKYALLHLEFYQNFKNHHAGKIKKPIWQIYVLYNPQGLSSGT